MGRGREVEGNGKPGVAVSLGTWKMPRGGLQFRLGARGVGDADPRRGVRLPARGPSGLSFQVVSGGRPGKALSLQTADPPSRVRVGSLAFFISLAYSASF